MSVMEGINQLAILIVSGRQSDELVEQLTRNNFHFTEIDSSGGMVQEPMVCLFVGIHHLRMPALLTLVREICRPQTQYIPTHVNFQPGITPMPMIEAQVGGALIYILNVERFEQL